MQRVGAGQERPHRGPRRPRQRDEPLGDRSRNEADRDGVGHQPVAQCLGIRAHRIGRKVHAGARDEVRPDLPHRRIEGGARVERRAIVRGDAEGAAVPRHEVREAAVSDLDALRPPGRAGRVDDVGQVLLLGDVVMRGERGRPRHRFVDVEPRPHGRRQASVDPHVGNGHAGRGVLEHERQPLGRRGRIERQVGGAGLQHAQGGDDEGSRALQTDRDDGIGADVESPEGLGQSPGAAIELSVGQGEGGVGHGKGVGGLGGLRGHRLRDEIENHGVWFVQAWCQTETPAMARRQHANDYENRQLGQYEGGSDCGVRCKGLHTVRSRLPAR